MKICKKDLQEQCRALKLSASGNIAILHLPEAGAPTEEQTEKQYQCVEAAARGVEARVTDSHIYGMAQCLGNKNGPNDNFAEALPCSTQQ